MNFPKSVLITGAAGFIGSNLTDYLLAQGVRVIGIDDLCDYYNPEIKRINLSSANAHEHFTLVEASICDGDALSTLFETHRPQAVIHLAARAGVRPSIQDPVLYSQTNVEGTVQLLQAAVQHDVEKFLFASSSSVYGNIDEVPFRESALINEPISPYASTKRAGELLCYTFHHLYQMPITCLRFFTVFGPRQRPDLAIHKFMRKIHAGEPIPVFGDGSTSRDYTFIEDIVEGICRALEHCSGYDIFNLGGSHPITLHGLIQAIEDVVGKKAIIDRQPAQPGDVVRTYADLEHVSQAIGYAPQTSIQEGLQAQWKWMQERMDKGLPIQ